MKSLEERAEKKPLQERTRRDGNTWGCSYCSQWLWQENSVYNHNVPAWAGTDSLRTNGKVLSRQVLVPLRSPFLQWAAEIALIFRPPLLMMQPWNKMGFCQISRGKKQYTATRILVQKRRTLLNYQKKKQTFVIWQSSVNSELGH